MPEAADREDWLRALTLSERAGLLRHAARQRWPSSSSSEEGEAAERSWRRQAPFSEKDWLRRRLSLDGLDEDSFASLLRVSSRSLTALHDQTPWWLARLRESFGRSSSTDEALIEASSGGDPLGGFLRLVSPLLSE